MSNIIQDLSPAKTGALNIKAMLNDGRLKLSDDKREWVKVTEKVIVIKILACEDEVVGVYVNEDGKFGCSLINDFTIL